MAAMLTRHFQEEGLPFTRLRSWTCHRCAYRLSWRTRSRLCMRWCWRGSVCWDRDWRRTPQKRPGDPTTPGLLHTTCRNDYAHLARKSWCI